MNFFVNWSDSEKMLENVTANFPLLYHIVTCSKKFPPQWTKECSDLTELNGLREGMTAENVRTRRNY
jgi:hypothetical protein